VGYFEPTEDSYSSLLLLKNELAQWEFYLSELYRKVALSIGHAELIWLIIGITLAAIYLCSHSGKEPLDQTDRRFRVELGSAYAVTEED